MEEIMNRCLGLMVGLAVAMFLGTAWGKDNKVKAAADVEASSCHGTSVNFVNTPSEAAQQAKKEEKLVFVLHVSGQFEDPGIT
jgi:hypothetical protein